MLNVFEALLDFFSMLGDFLLNIVTGLASLLSMIPKAMVTMDYVASYIPAELGVFAIAGISICVVFHILGR